MSNYESKILTLLNIALDAGNERIRHSIDTYDAIRNVLSMKRIDHAELYAELIEEAAEWRVAAIEFRAIIDSQINRIRKGHEGEQHP